MSSNYVGYSFDSIKAEIDRQTKEAGGSFDEGVEFTKEATDYQSSLVGKSTDDNLSHIRNETSKQIEDTKEEEKNLWDTFMDWIDRYIWDTDVDEAWLEALYKGWIGGEIDDADLATSEGYEKVMAGVRATIEAVKEAEQEAQDIAPSWLDGVLEKIDIDLQPAFTWLADRFEDLLRIPANAFFSFLEAILPEKE